MESGTSSLRLSASMTRGLIGFQPKVHRIVAYFALDVL